MSGPAWARVMYADVGEFGQNRRVDSAQLRFLINRDIGFLRWPKLSIPVQRAISCLLPLSLADRHVQPDGRRKKKKKKKQALKIPTSGRDEGEDTKKKRREESK